MLISAEKARVTTHKINDECIEAILEQAIEEAIKKGHYYCYVTFGDTYALIEATFILKEKKYSYEYCSNKLTLKIEW